MERNLKGKVAIITGGGGVLCKAMAIALAHEGVKIAVINRGFEKGQAVVKEIESFGGEAVAISCDVLRREELLNARETVRQHWGGLDILINGAGGNKPEASTTTEYYEAASPIDATSGGTASVVSQSSSTRGFFDLDENAFRGVFDLNLMGTFLPSQVFMPLMIGRQGATVIHISSMAAFSPMTKVPAYAGAKAAINNLTQWMAVHFAQSGIRVNAIAPGFFSTEQNKALLWNPDGTPTARTHKIIEHTPMRRLGKAEELCGCILWLCDPESSGFVTGAVIPVDGGFMAYSGV